MSTLNRISKIARREGPAGIGMRLLRQLGYRRTGWFVHPIDQSASDVPSEPGVTVALLALEDAAAYRTFRPTSVDGIFERRLDDGHVCFGAWIDGEIAAASWVATGRAWAEDLACWIDLEPDEIYIYGSGTLPKYRGRRLHGLLSRYLIAYYRERGFRHAICIIRVTNKPAIKSRVRSGYRRTGTIVTYGIGKWRRRVFHGDRN